MTKIEKMIKKLEIVERISSSIFVDNRYIYAHTNENGGYEADEGREEEWEMFLEIVSEIQTLIEKHYCK